ncbi:MAG: M56 family metallopeptidase [Gemmataceae bacterium]
MTLLFSWLASNLIVATLLALLVAVVRRWGKRPALAHGLCLLILVKLVTPPLFPLPLLRLEASPSDDPRSAALEPTPAIPIIAPPPSPAPAVDADPKARDGAAPDADPLVAVVMPPEPQAITVAVPTPAETPFPVLTAFAGLWAFGGVVWLAFAGLRLRRFQRVLRLARPASAALQAEAALAARLLGVRCPEISVLPGAVSPLLWAFGRRARLVLPQALLERLSGAQRSAMLVHELAHYRRRDHWVRWLELVVLSVYWWCPVVWWTRREMQEAEEECCDAWVVWALPEAAKEYAFALVETVDFLAGVRAALPPCASGMASGPFLKRRLTMILSGVTPRRLTLSGVALLLGAAALLLPLMPTWAQEGQDEPTPKPGKTAKGDDLGKLADELKRAQAQFDAARAAYEARIAELRAQLKKAEDLLAAPGTVTKAKVTKVVVHDIVPPMPGARPTPPGASALKALGWGVAVEPKVKVIVVDGTTGKIISTTGGAGMGGLGGLPAIPGVPAVPAVPPMPFPAGGEHNIKVIVIDGATGKVLRTEGGAKVEGGKLMIVTPKGKEARKESDVDDRIRDIERKLGDLMRELHSLKSKKTSAAPPAGGFFFTPALELPAPAAGVFVPAPGTPPPIGLAPPGPAARPTPPAQP